MRTVIGLSSNGTDDDFMLLFNAHHEDMQFVLPPPLDRGAWRVQRPTSSSKQVAIGRLVAMRMGDTAPFFLGSDVQSRFVLVHGVRGIPRDIVALIFHSVVMPVIRILPDSVTRANLLMSVQESALGSSGAAGAAACCWSWIIPRGCARR